MRRWYLSSSPVPPHGDFVGISSHDYADLVGQGAPDAYSNTGSSLSIAANRISYVLDLHGPSMAIDTACSSGLVCVHQACRSLIEGACDLALVGAANLLAHARPWIGFAKASMLSPTGALQKLRRKRRRLCPLGRGRHGRAEAAGGGGTRR